MTPKLGSLFCVKAATFSFARETTRLAICLVLSITPLKTNAFLPFQINQAQCNALRLTQFWSDNITGTNSN